MAEGPLLWRKLLIQLTLVYDLGIMSICNFGYFPFWFPGRDFDSDCTSSYVNFTLNV